MLYCIRCNKLINPEHKKCTCGYKKLRLAEDKDPVFLVTKNYMYGAMLQDILSKEKIPYITKPVREALAFFLDRTTFAKNHYFVPFGALEKAKELLKYYFTEEGVEEVDWHT